MGLPETIPDGLNVEKALRHRLSPSLTQNALSTTIYLYQQLVTL